VSKINSTWYISPPYMLPRFIEKIVNRLYKNWNQNIDNSDMLNAILEKNITIILSDWVKRSTFAFGSESAMNSSIGWLPEYTFDFDAMRMNYKFGYKKASSFLVNVYNLSQMTMHAVMGAPRVVKFESQEALNLANKNFADCQSIIASKQKNQINQGTINTIKSWSRSSSNYSGKTYILARGKSSGIISDMNLKALKEDTVIYVNDWKKLLTVYAYSNFSEDSINIHFLNRDIDLNVLERRQYFDKTFSLIQLNASNDENELVKKINNFCYGHAQPCAALPVGIIKTQVKTAGLHAVFYAVKVLKRKDIEIFGLDFFEANYLTEHVVSKKPEPQPYQPAKGKIAKAQFIKLVEANPGVNFVIHTYANFSHTNLKNLTVNQAKE